MNTILNAEEIARLRALVAQAKTDALEGKAEPKTIITLCNEIDALIVAQQTQKNS